MKNMSRPFEGLLGNNSELRMLEYLLPLKGIEFNITELAEEVGVSRVTATRNVKKFVEWRLLNLTRTAGATTYYSINHESPIVKSVEQFNNALIENILGNETLYEIHEYWETQRPHALAEQPALGETLFHHEFLPQVCAYGFVEDRGIGLVDSKSLPSLWSAKEAPTKAPTFTSAADNVCLPGSQPLTSGGAT
jgi:predicted transcriptional regulator